MNQGLPIVWKARGAVIPFTSDTADSAAVEQIDADGEPVPGKIAVPGMRAGGVYFLDLPRGRYALKSISFAARGARYEVELVGRHAPGRGRAARPGSAAFLGELTLDGRFPDFDVAVERAFDVVGHWLPLRAGR